MTLQKTLDNRSHGGGKGASGRVGTVVCRTTTKKVTFEVRKEWHHQLPHWVTPTLATPLVRFVTTRTQHMRPRRLCYLSFEWCDQTEVLTTRWQVFLAQETSDTWTVNCRFNHSIVLLHLCKEYLTAVKFKKTLFLLQMKYWTFWCMDYSSDQIQYVGERVKWS